MAGFTRAIAALLAGAAVAIGSGDGASAQSGARPAAASKEWPTYGHDPGGMRFSPLTEITPANVGQLKVAWTYHMRPAGAAVPGGRGAGPVEGVGDAPQSAPGGGRGPGQAEGIGGPPQNGRGQGRGAGSVDGSGNGAQAGRGRGRGG